MSQTVTKTYKTKDLLHRFLPYLLRYKKMLAFDLFCAALTTLCDIVLPRIMFHLTNTAMYQPAALTIGWIGKVAGLYIVLRLIDAAAYYYMCSRGHIMGVYIETDMRMDAFRKLETLSDAYFSNTKIGHIMGRITSDLFDVTEFAHHCPEEFFIAAIKIVVSFIILSFSSLPLTILVFACLPLMLFLSIRLNHRFRNATKSNASSWAISMHASKIHYWANVSSKRLRRKILSLKSWQTAMNA